MPPLREYAYLHKTSGMRITILAYSQASADIKLSSTVLLPKRWIKD